MTDQGPVRVERLDDGAFARLVLDRPKGNVLDAEMVGALREAVAVEARRGALKALIIEGEGKHFSFGASVEEHLPGLAGAMLEGFHGLFRDLIEAGRPVLAVVRGQCLGGGLEVASFAQRVFASPTAMLGQPEIRLACFAPVGSLVLPRRVGQAAADDLLLTGRVVDAEEALRLGLVDDLSDDPGEAAVAWAREAFGACSPAALAAATRAARHDADRRFLDGIDRLEADYLQDLEPLPDYEEGLRAFLEKRTPRWATE